MKKNNLAKESTKIPSQLFKRSITRAIKKMESKIPYYFQAYSDLYRVHLQMLDDYFTAYYLLEHRFYKNHLLDEKSVLYVFDDIVYNTTSNALSQIEVFTNMNKILVEKYTSTLKIFDHNMHQLLDYYKLQNPEN